MGRGAVGAGEPGRARYRLMLWRSVPETRPWGLYEADWWDDDPAVLRLQAEQGAALLGAECYYRLWDTETGKQIAVIGGGKRERANP